MNWRRLALDRAVRVAGVVVAVASVVMALKLKPESTPVTSAPVR